MFRAPLPTFELLPRRGAIGLDVGHGDCSRCGLRAGRGSKDSSSRFLFLAHAVLALGVGGDARRRGESLLVVEEVAFPYFAGRVMNAPVMSQSSDAQSKS